MFVIKRRVFDENKEKKDEACMFLMIKMKMCVGKDATNLTTPTVWETKTRHDYIYGLKTIRVLDIILFFFVIEYFVFFFFSGIVSRWNG